MIQIPGMRAGNRIDNNVTWLQLEKDINVPVASSLEGGTKSLVNTGGSGLPLARLLGGGITLVVRGTILHSEVPFFL